MNIVVRRFLQNKYFVKAILKGYIKTRKGNSLYEGFDERCRNAYPVNTYSLNQKTKESLFAECIYYRYKYGVSIVDYFLYEFYRCSEREIRTFMTERNRVELFHYADEEAYLHIFGSKKDFYTEFHDYMQKDCFFIDKTTAKENFVSFAGKYESIVIKPIDGQRGIGVEVLSISNLEEMDAAWKKCEVGGFLAEKVIEGCDDLQAFHPKSLNTIRVSTAVTKGGTPYVMAATIRTGTGNHSVDNGHSEGVYAAIDVRTGIICTIGFNANGYRFPLHPDSKKTFAGTQIPKWNELCELSRKVAVQIPQMRYIGWDWALNSNYEWVLIEGNEPGGIDVHQHPVFTGLLESYKKVLYAE